MRRPTVTSLDLWPRNARKGWMAAEWQCRSQWAIHENHENHGAWLMAAGATERILRYRPWRADGGCGCWEKIEYRRGNSRLGVVYRDMEIGGWELSFEAATQCRARSVSRMVCSLLSSCRTHSPGVECRTCAAIHAPMVVDNDLQRCSMIALGVLLLHM